MRDRRITRRVGRMIVWLSYPLYFPLVRGFGLWRTGSDLMRHLPDHTADAETTAPEAIMEDQVQRGSLRYKTRNYGLFCGLLLVMFFAVWLYDIFWENQPIFGPVCIQLGALICMLAGQFIFLSFSNWTIRNGRPGSFAEFISNGRNLWPR